MISNQSYNNFAGGEISPNTWGRTDRPFYNTSLEVQKNFISLLTGPSKYRPGFPFINHTRLNRVAFKAPFVFNTEQAYTLEFTDKYMRVFKDGGVVLETAKNITGITQANPGVITSVAHGFSTGDEIYIASVVGMTELNGQFFLVVKINNDTFSLTDIDGTAINTTTYTAYSSGGTASRVYEITTPYAEADLFQLKFGGTADVAYITHPYYLPRKLTRTGHAAWTLSLYTRTSDPFTVKKVITGITQANPGEVTTSAAHGYATGDIVIIEEVVGMTQVNSLYFTIIVTAADKFTIGVDTTAYTAWSSAGYATKRNLCPGAVGLYGGRLHMGGSDSDPDGWYASKSPSAATGASQFDDFTVGTAAGDAFVFGVSSQTGTADRIRWFQGNSKFLGIGTSGGVYKANGGTDGVAITPTNVSVTPISSYGVADINPLFVGQQTVYLEVGGRTIRSFEFSLLDDSYAAFDKNVLSDEITFGGITQIAFTQGRPDIIWGVRADGVLLSCTFLSREEIAGWARQEVGGNGIVLSVAPDKNVNSFDRLVAVVERTINGHTRRYVEYLSEDDIIPDRADFYTGAENFEEDEARWRNLVFEKQIRFNRLDSSLALDTTQSMILTLSALTGNGVTATAGSAAFLATDVGKYIYIKYLTGDEAGVALITAFTSATQVTVNILQDFLTLVIPASGWYLLTTTVRGLWHLEGATVGVLVDGGVHPNKTVSNGAITLDYPARYVSVGYKYKGILRFPDFEFGVVSGVAQGRMRNIQKIIFKLRDTLGGKFGTTLNSLYELQDLAYRVSSQDYTDRPPVLFSGIKEQTNFDKTEQAKHIWIVQDEPQPFTLIALIPHIEVED